MAFRSAHGLLAALIVNAACSSSPPTTASDAAVVSDSGAADAGVVDTGPLPQLAITVVTSSASEFVRPGEKLAVHVLLQNDSNIALQADEFDLAFVGDPLWQNADLKLDCWVGVGSQVSIDGMLVAPATERVESLFWKGRYKGTTFGSTLSVSTEVRCSDGVFCNGAERLVGGHCVSGPLPCDDGQSCTEDLCDEATGLCDHNVSLGCNQCTSQCVADCTGRVCGDDGCGGSCGLCGNSACAAAGVCVPFNGPGTCANPLPLVIAGEPFLGHHIRHTDTSTALNLEDPAGCNLGRTFAPDVVYTFTTTRTTGMEAVVSGYDTTLALRRENPAAPGTACHNNTVAGALDCNDDDTPPGGHGSRLFDLLSPGTYYLVVDGYDAYSYGPLTLDVKFANNCVPRCDNKLCGPSDGCGGDCGLCQTGEVCSTTPDSGGVAYCHQQPCVPDCTGKQCGDDTCGGSCGSCPTGALCVDSTQTCQMFASCNHLQPSCNATCGADSFCGSDCACHATTGPLPDLVVDRNRLLNEIVIETRNFPADSCAIAENCVGGSGDRKLLRFSLEAVNQGTANLVMGSPTDRPDLFVYSPCHNHYHFIAFSNYALLDQSGAVVVRGRKQAFCMEDTEQIRFGPEVACEIHYDCDHQGIQAGWADIYDNQLDCQWLDITGLPSGDYQLQAHLNPQRIFQEASFENNVTTVPVTIP